MILYFLIYYQFYKKFLYVEVQYPEIYTRIFSLLFLQNNSSCSYHIWTLVPMPISHMTFWHRK